MTQKDVKDFRKTSFKSGDIGEKLFYDFKKSKVSDLKHTKNPYDCIDFISRKYKRCYEVKNISMRNNHTHVLSIGLNKIDDFIKKYKGYKFFVVYIFENKYIYQYDLTKDIKDYKEGKIEIITNRWPRDFVYIYSGVCNKAYKVQGNKNHLQIPISKIKIVKRQREQYKHLFMENTKYYRSELK